MYSEVCQKLLVLFGDFFVESILIFQGFFMNLFQSFDFLAEVILNDLILVSQLQQALVDFQNFFLNGLHLCFCQRFLFMNQAGLKYLRNTE